jgi:heme-degrading monooxygenase HmoA
VYARISTYELEPDRADDAVVAFRGAIDRIGALAGLVDAFLLLELDGARAVTITLWESLAAMEASRVVASKARTDAAREVESTVTSTIEYAVPIRMAEETRAKILRPDFT